MGAPMCPHHFVPLQTSKSFQNTQDMKVQSWQYYSCVKLMLNAGWGTTFFYLPTPKYILWNHFRPFLIDFDFFFILIFESENRLVNPQCLVTIQSYRVFLHVEVGHPDRPEPDISSHQLTTIKLDLSGRFWIIFQILKQRKSFQ